MTDADIDEFETQDRLMRELDPVGYAQIDAAYARLSGPSAACGSNWWQVLLGQYIRACKLQELF